MSKKEQVLDVMVELGKKGHVVGEWSILNEAMDVLYDLGVNVCAMQEYYDAEEKEGSEYGIEMC